VTFLRRLGAEDASLTPPVLAARVAAHFGVQVHPRSIERVLQRAEKNAAEIRRAMSPGGDGENRRAITQRLP